MKKKSAGKHSPNSSIKLYELAQSALLHEADRIWSRFTVYLTLNSAVLTLLALSVKDMVMDPGRHNLSTEIAWAGLALAFIGLCLSVCWLRTTQAGRQWQDFFTERLCKLEQELEEELPEANLWTTVKNRATNNEKHISVMRWAKRINYGFIVIWAIVLFIVSVILVCKAVCSSV